MAKYAEGTTVSVAKSRAEIEAILTRYGVVERAFADAIGKSSIQFRHNDRTIRFVLQLPNPADDEFKWTAHKNRYQRQLRSDDSRLAAWEQACRQRWRALALAIKAKLEAVEAGIATFEEEFLAYIVVPGGETFGKHALPAIAEAYTKNTVPLLGFAG